LALRAGAISLTEQEANDKYQELSFIDPDCKKVSKPIECFKYDGTYEQKDAKAVTIVFEKQGTATTILLSIVDLNTLMFDCQKVLTKSNEPTT
jgi:hypothetical protein